MFAHSIPIPASGLEAWLAELPARPAVFALLGRVSAESGNGNAAASEPYVSKTADLRRRARRLLTPATAATKRLNLAGRAVEMSYSEVGSEFETSVLLLQATRHFFGERAQQRLHLRSPALLRMAWENRYPRVYVTHRLAMRALANTYGPFPSRGAAERFLESALNLFELRRCTPELDPDPAFPGCVYSEMKMCLAPCFRGCTDERYAAEAEAVRQFLATRGMCSVGAIQKERDAASAAMDFEKAAALHQRLQNMKEVAQQAAPLVHPIASLDALVLQPAVQDAEETSTQGRVAMYLVRAGIVTGPAFYSVEGMRHPNEQSGSSSLFAHPTMVEAIPLAGAVGPMAMPGMAVRVDRRGELEQRLMDGFDGLERQADQVKPNADLLSQHLAVLGRWYYRPSAKRAGEIFFREEDGNFPLAKVLRGISRVFRGQREAVPEAGAATAHEQPL